MFSRCTLIFPGFQVEWEPWTYAFFPISYGYEINLRLNQHQYNNRTLLEPFILGSNKLMTIRKSIKF